MKTFNEFINEDSHFLRSIGKNDKVIDKIDKITFGDLTSGDLFFTTSVRRGIFGRVFHAYRFVKLSDDGKHIFYTEDALIRDYLDCRPAYDDMRNESVVKMECGARGIALFSDFEDVKNRASEIQPECDLSDEEREMLKEFM